MSVQEVDFFDHNDLKPIVKGYYSTVLEQFTILLLFTTIIVTSVLRYINVSILFYSILLNCWKLSQNAPNPNIFIIVNCKFNSKLNFCKLIPYPMDNCLSGRRRPARQTPEKDVLCLHRPAGPSTVHSQGGAWYLLPV